MRTESEVLLSVLRVVLVCHEHHMPTVLVDVRDQLLVKRVLRLRKFDVRPHRHDSTD